ncbi:MAG: hypothetical protein WCX64_01780 [Candidatus Micrarchaeia archaeon]
MERKPANALEWEGHLKKAREQLDLEESRWLPGAGDKGKSIDEFFGQRKKNLELMGKNIKRLHLLENEPVPENPTDRNRLNTLIKETTRLIELSHNIHKESFNQQKPEAPKKWLFKTD